MAELGPDLRTPPLNVTVWEFQQDLRTPGAREAKPSSQQHPGVTPASRAALTSPEMVFLLL